MPLCSTDRSLLALPELHGAQFRRISGPWQRPYRPVLYLPVQGHVRNLPMNQQIRKQLPITTATVDGSFLSPTSLGPSWASSRGRCSDVPPGMNSQRPSRAVVVSSLASARHSNTGAAEVHHKEFLLLQQLPQLADACISSSIAAAAAAFSARCYCTIHKSAIAGAHQTVLCKRPALGFPLSYLVHAKFLVQVASQLNGNCDARASCLLSLFLSVSLAF